MRIHTILNQKGERGFFGENAWQKAFKRLVQLTDQHADRGNVQHWVRAADVFAILVVPEPCFFG